LGVEKQVACDVYFKKMGSDIETYYGLIKKDGTVSITSETPSAEQYTFARTECNTNATATWDETNRQLSLSNITDKTICTGYFNEK